MQASKIIAYFDFDGTLTYKDTLFAFLIYTVGYWKFLIKLPKLIPILLSYSFSCIDNEKAKELCLTCLIQTYSKSFLGKKAKNFAISKLNKYIKPEIYAKLEWHREQGHMLCIISANLAIYLKYWVRLHKIDYLLATEIEFNPGMRATGKLKTRNCYGIEKVNRIKQFLELEHLNFSYSYAYGNSKGDYALLSFANEAYFIEGEDLIDWKTKQN